MLSAALCCVMLFRVVMACVLSPPALQVQNMCARLAASRAALLAASFESNKAARLSPKPYL